MWTDLFDVPWYPSASHINDGSNILREGDIAVSTGRRNKVCFARSCLWSKSVDGYVYIAYNLSPEYCMFSPSYLNQSTLQVLNLNIYINNHLYTFQVGNFFVCFFLPHLNHWTAEVETNLIKKGMENIEKDTCVRFVPRTHQRDYIDIQQKSG